MKLENNGLSVELVGHYGGDESHAMSAWTSTAREITDEKRGRIDKLLNMLADAGHHTPFEKSMLHFVVTTDIATHIHIIKHRIGVACLSGDTEVQFLNTNGDTSPRYKFTMSELWDKWNRGRPGQDTQKDMEYSRRRIQEMDLESLDLDSLEINSTHIKNVIFNGVKEVFELTLESGHILRCTRDHLLRTKNGWEEAKNCWFYEEPVAYKAHTRFVEKPVFVPPDVDETLEVWTPVIGFEGSYDVSSYGRVRSYYNNRYLTDTPKLKQLTVSGDRFVVSLGRETVHVHRLVLEAFHGSCPSLKHQGRHLNNNALDNRIENLAWGTVAENQFDWDTDEGRPRNRIRYSKIVSWRSLGAQQVFDLEVESADHNFTANGIVVHNCNAESARYKELKEDKSYVPSDWPEDLQDQLQGHINESQAEYHRAVDKLVEFYVSQGDDKSHAKKRAKESARFFLPYATCITADVAFNWRSFAHFQGLRNSEHAQKEVRWVAQSMLTLVKEIEGNPFKLTIEAFKL
jgi:thymidylate synthase ThyX